MCGILSVVGTSTPPLLFEKALRSLHHRGPDGSGVYSNDTVLIGHRLLHIRTAEPLPQPLYNEDESIVVAVNGEIYDAEDLRASLIKKGHHFRTMSDSELVVHLYEDYGENFLHLINGEFAFVLWDSVNKKLIAARDRFGIKPLYWTHFDNGIALASESKAFFELGVRPEWDLQTISHVFTHQYPCPEQSLFLGIRQLRPGHFLKFERNTIEIQKYWELSFHGHEVQSSLDQTAELRRLLFSAVQRRLVGNAKKAIALSGGIDSASILAVASELTDVSLPCYTVRFDDATYDESPIAEKTASHFGQPFKAVHVSQMDLLDALEDAVWMGESLAINGQLSAKYLLSKQMKADGIKVVLSGEGADEAFLGYPHFKQDLCAMSDIKPPWLKSLSSQNALTQGIFLPRKVSSRYSNLPAFLRAKLEFADVFQPLMCASKTLSIPKVLNHLMESLGNAPTQLIRQAQKSWIELALANYILRGIGDGMEMAHGIEGRPSFLDHHLFEWAVKQPLHCHIEPLSGVEKSSLRKAMVGILPDWMVCRPKHPFIAPPIHHSANPKCHATIKSILNSSYLDDLPFVDAEKVRSFSFVKSVPEAPLMLILSMCLMQKRMVEQRERTADSRIV